MVSTGNSYAAPPIQPVTVPADQSIVPSPPNVALASRMPQSETLTTEKTSTIGKPMNTSPEVVEANPIEFQITTVIVPVVVGLVAIILVVLGSSLVWIRIKRAGRASRNERSSSIDEEKDIKNEALKTLSNITTSSVDEDEHAISLQHWTSKKAVSNRYESWHIGEIDQEWVSQYHCRELLLSIF